MTGWKALRGASVLLLVLAVAVPLFAATAKPASAPKIDPKAVDLLRQMNDYIAGLPSFSVHVESTRDLMLPSDQALSSDMSYDLMVNRPNALRINMNSAAGGAQVYYDGKSLTIYRPKENYFATTPAPATIEETAREAMKRGLALPLAEFIGQKADRRLVENMTSATFVGSSLVGGTMTNHLAFRQKGGIDWQIWVDEGAAPLPRKLVVIDRRAKDYPRYSATMTDWNTSPAFDASTFAFTAPQGARQINFRELPRPAGFGTSAPKR